MDEAIAEVAALRARLAALEASAAGPTAADWNAAFRRVSRGDPDPDAEALGLNDYLRHRRDRRRLTDEVPTERHDRRATDDKETPR